MSYQILLVDDDPDFRAEMRECLSNRYRVMEAASGEEAIQLIKQPNAIDVVILDVMMPGLSGTDVLKHMRQLNPSLGIVILTGRSSKDIAIEAVKGHADDYIEKPLDMDYFFKAIEKILHRQDAKGLDGLTRRSKIERVKRFLERNNVRKVSLNDVAQEVCLSEKYLSRVFKEKTGMGFSEYRLKLKMDKARDLLKHTDASVDQLAHQLGYKNLESFVRIFKKVVGQTPTTYRLGHPLRKKHGKRKLKKIH